MPEHGDETRFAPAGRSEQPRRRAAHSGVLSFTLAALVMSQCVVSARAGRTIELGPSNVPDGNPRPTPRPTVQKDPTSGPTFEPTPGPTIGATPMPTRVMHDQSYADLAVKIDYSRLDGPGQHLLHGIFLGDTISRQTFDTQFLLDISRSVNVSTDRIYVLNVTAGKIHYEWEVTNVIVAFRILEPLNQTCYSMEKCEPGSGPGQRAVVAAVQDLTNQAQTPSSKLYGGNVTDAVDFLWGVVALQWDLSLKLMVSIEVVGARISREERGTTESAYRFDGAPTDVQDGFDGEVTGYYLNQVGARAELKS